MVKILALRGQNYGFLVKIGQNFAFLRTGQEPYNNRSNKSNPNHQITKVLKAMMEETVYSCNNEYTNQSEIRYQSNTIQKLSIYTAQLLELFFFPIRFKCHSCQEGEKE